MKNKIGFGLLFLLGFVLGIVLLSHDARAQQPALDGNKKDQAAAADSKGAPAADDKKDQAKELTPVVSTSDKKGQSTPAAEKDANPYTIDSSVEFGVRGIAIEGDANKYRSDLNYQPGFRLFDSTFLMKSKENNGLLFDNLMVNSYGWGNDPSRQLRVNVEKTGWYRFDANYRRFDYFNALTNLALGQHTADTENRLGDFDLTLLPQNNRIKFNLGYSFNRNSGATLTTYDYQRDEFPLVSPVRSASDEFRLGADAKLWIFDLSFQQGWRFFKDDTTYTATNQPGNNTTNFSAINTFTRDLPTRGTTPFTRFSLHTLIAKKVDITARAVYTNTTTHYLLNEAVTGVDAIKNNIILDSFTAAGNAKRPTAMGDLGVTVFVTDRFRLSDTFRVNDFHIDGGRELIENLLETRSTVFRQTPLPPVFVDQFSFRTTQYRRYVNTFEGDYDFSRQFSIHAGYRYTSRHIELDTNDFSFSPVVPGSPGTEVFDNTTNAFFVGFKARPVKIWSVYFDLERGSADNVFVNTANYDYTNVRLRSIVRPTKTLSINGSFVTKDNTNPSPLNNLATAGSGVSVKSRIFTGSVDWTPSDKFNISSGYTHSHLTSEAEIIFFNNNVEVNGLSRYFMAENYFFVSTFAQVHPRLRLYAGYRINKDPGQGEHISAPTVLVGSFPYQSQSPEFKIAVKLHQRVDWIAGYQYFDYKETFLNLQHYRAHLPYTSLRIYFGRRD